ncbi:phage terminase small subunit [Marinomonas sp.]
MNLIQKRRLAKMAAQNAQKEAAKPANKNGKGVAPKVSKMKQKLAKKKAQAEAVKLEADKTKVEADKQGDDLENQVDDLKDSVENQADKAEDLAETVEQQGEQLDSVKDDVNDLENRVDGVEYDVQKIKDRLEDDSQFVGNPELETHKVIMADAIDEMKNLEDIEDRASYKAEAIKRVEAFVMGYVESAAKYPNIVAVWMMVFLFDLGDIARAVPLALHLAKQQVHKMPQRFNSSIYQFICDYVYDWSVTQLEANKSAGPYLEQVIQAIESDKWQLSNIVHGKMYAIYGKHLEALSEDEAALNAFEKAMDLNERAGVKKKIERLRAKLKV